MKLFNSFLTIQCNGSKVLGILRGKKSEIEQAFYSLYNFRATSGEIEYHGESEKYSNNGSNDDDSYSKESIGTFWTSLRQLQDYFYNIHFFKFEHHRNAVLVSRNILLELDKEENQEVFLNLNSSTLVIEGLAMGKIRAENLDFDIKDAIISSSQTLEKPRNQGNPDYRSMEKPEPPNIQSMLTVIDA